MRSFLNTIWFDYSRATKTKGLNRGVAKSCINCKKKICLRLWDSWNNFLVRCPFCERLHGNRWNKKAILWASFLLQPISFFFTLRPSRAVIFVSIYFLIGFIGNYIFSLELLNILVEVLGAFLFLAFPMIVNGFLLIIHNHDCGIPLGRKELGLELTETAADLFS